MECSYLGKLDMMPARQIQCIFQQRPAIRRCQNIGHQFTIRNGRIWRKWERFGMEAAICQFFTLVRDLATVVLSDPSTFSVLILFSYTFVSMGLLSYCLYLRRSK